MISHRENFRTVEEGNLPGEVPQDVTTLSESLVQIIWRRRWIVFLSTVVVLAAAFVYIVKATPIYTSTSRIYVEQSGPKIISETEGVMTQSKNYLYTQAELLKSTPVLSSALEKSGIRGLKIFQEIDNLIVFLKKKGLKVSVGKKDDIISVSSNSPVPVEAAKLINAIVDSYVTYHASRKRSTSAEVLKILQSEKTKRGKELTEKLKAMMDFKRENIAIALENQSGNIILKRLERLSEALTLAQLATIDAESAYETAKSMVSDPVGLKQLVEAEMSNRVYSSAANERSRLRQDLNKLQLQLSDRSRQVTPDHPSIQALRDDVEKVKNQIAEMDRKFAEAELLLAKQHYLAAKEKEAQISKYFEEQRQESLTLNDQVAQYTILQSEWEQTKKLCDILDDRIKELNVTEDVGALNISILEVARPADKPSEPQKARIMAMALVLALMLGGGLALLRDWMDQRLRSAEEISAILGVPVLGVVPSMSKRKSIAARGQKVHLDSNSNAAEAYRTIRTSVFFGVPKGEAKTVLITSPGPGDGKTTLVSNLAIAMAQAGQKVLILDADFRKPMQHRIFDIDRDKGLAGLLAGATTLKEAIQPTQIKGLEVLPCGPDVPNPSEILNSDTFAKILETLSTNKYDRIIIDSPPVMPVTDAQILAAICDITLLILRAEKTTRKFSQQARDGLLSVGAHILGAVVNDVSRKNGHYGYYSGYGYYGYGRRKKERPIEKKPAAVSEGIGSDRTQILENSR
ncbi:MAG: GumC family protein [Planctomycetota bacterium]